jgi:adenine-specific DNA-methyltransferase
MTAPAQHGQLRTASEWGAALGLLPVPMVPGLASERHVLLNGASGNFCLDFVGGTDRALQRATAWSCDVGHYVCCLNDVVTVNHWDSRSREDKYSWKSVATRLHDFHRHLERTSSDRSKNVASHVLRVFRQIRSALNEDASGERSLAVLLHLLASVALGQQRLSARELEQAGLASDLGASSDSITPATWNVLHSDLVGTGRYDIPNPNFDLVLHHASGVVFQDAHLAVQLSSMPWLPGLEGAATVERDAAFKESGIYYTPVALARTLAEEAVRDAIHSDNAVRIFDPACGSGELLKECLRVLKLNNFRNRVVVTGWDTSAASVALTRFVLGWEKRNWQMNQLEFSVEQRDSLRTDWPSTDILVMNPPFRSWVAMSAEERDLVSGLVAGDNRPNLAMAFAIRATQSVSNEGSLAMIAPNSLLEASSGRVARERLSETFKPRLLARLGDQTLFARALVDAGLYVGTRTNAPVESTVLWADQRPNSVSGALRGLRRWRGAPGPQLVEEGFSVYKRTNVGADQDSWRARSFQAWRTFECVNKDGISIPARKLFDIRQGIRLGNDVFVIRRERLDELPKKERRFFRPAVMNPSIVDGQLASDYFVFYPYSNGLPPIETEEDLKTLVPSFYETELAPLKDKLEGRSLDNARLRWWDLLRHRAWQEGSLPKLVSKYFGDVKAFAYDREGEFVVVVGQAWILKRGAKPIDVLTDEDLYLAMLAYLSSISALHLMGYVSVQVAGGQWDLSNKYMKDLPLPNLARARADQVSELVRIGSVIASGSFNEWSHLNDLVNGLLGLDGDAAYA